MIRRLLVVASLLLGTMAFAQEAATPWIGVAIEAGTRGVMVKDVLEKTPGERAGLKPGDEVLSIDGIAVKKPQELIGRVQEKGIGEKVALVVARGGKELRF